MKLIQFKDTSSINFKRDRVVESCCAWLTTLGSTAMNIATRCNFYLQLRTMLTLEVMKDNHSMQKLIYFSH